MTKDKQDLARGDLVAARRDCLASLAIAEDIKNPRVQSAALGHLGWIDHTEGHVADAHMHLTRALELATSVNARAKRGTVLARLAHLESLDGDAGLARAQFLESEALLRDVNARAALASALILRGHLNCREDKNSQARAAFDEALAIADALGAGPQSQLVQDLQALREVLSATLDHGPVGDVTPTVGQDQPHGNIDAS